MTDWPYRYWLLYEDLLAVGRIFDHMPWLNGASRFDANQGRLYLLGPFPEQAVKTSEKCFELTKPPVSVHIQLHGEPV